MKNTARRSSAVATLSVLAVLLVAGCGGSGDTAGGANETKTIRVATSVSNSFPFIVVQAGKALGTWKGTGLDVKVVEGTTPTIGQIMAGGKADIALAGAGSEAASIHSGVPMTVVASNLSYWDQRIIARPGTKSVEDLKGANFGVSGAGSPGEYSIVKMAEKLGWKRSDYKFTSLGNLPSLTAALKAGSIDAFAWSSQAAMQLEQSGDGKIVGSGADYVGKNVLQSFAVMDEFAKDNPNTVQKFFKAYFATLSKIQDKPQLFTDVLVKNWDVEPEVAERLAKESLPKLSADGVIHDDELKGVRDSVVFSLDVPADEVDDVKYTYWKDLK